MAKDIGHWLNGGAVLAAGGDRVAELPQALRRMLKDVQALSATNALSDGGLEHALLEHEERIRAGATAARVLVRVGPSLGLIGTLIPMGTALAALATGNVVLAKPAEATPLIATRAVAMMHEAGIPRDAIQLLPGDGAVVGAALVDGGASGDVLVVREVFLEPLEVAGHDAHGNARGAHHLGKVPADGAGAPAIL